LFLSTLDGVTFTGTLAAWDDNLVLPRQWTDSASIEEWHRYRVLPTIAYLEHEKFLPKELYVWGSSSWPDCGICVKIIQSEIPIREII